MVGASVLLATGQEPDLKHRWKKGSAIHFIQGKEGIIKRIEMEDALLQLEGVVETVIYKKAGDAVHGTRSSNDRLGHIITVGDTATEALEIGKKGLGMVRVVYE